MEKILKLLTLTSLLLSNLAQADDAKSFEMLKQLVGNWSGTLNRSNGEAVALTLSYSVRSNGSALLEESNGWS